MTKDSTPSLFVNSPVRKSLQRLIQNQTLWTAPLVAILFASLIRWIITLYPYSGSMYFYYTRANSFNTDNLLFVRLQYPTHVW